MPDDLRNIVSDITSGPRKALDEAEKMAAEVRDFINQREGVLIAAIEEHEELSKIATDGAGQVVKAMQQIHHAYTMAMQPKPQTAPESIRPISSLMEIAARIPDAAE